MDRSLFLARLIGPTFVAIAVGMLINLNMYESMIAETLRPSILAQSVRRLPMSALAQKRTWRQLRELFRFTSDSTYTLTKAGNAGLSNSTRAKFTFTHYGSALSKGAWLQAA